MQPCVREVSESFEDDAAIKLLAVANQQVTVCAFAPHVCRKAVRDVVDTPTHLRRTQHVDQRPSRIRDCHFDGTAPKSFQSEEALGFDALQRKTRALRNDTLFAHASCSENESFVEELFGQLPMMSCGPAADV